MKTVFRRYKHTWYLLLSFIIIYYFGKSELGHTLIHQFIHLGYIGSFIVGIFFVSAFTVVPATLVLFKFAQVYDPLVIALTAGIGGMVGDYVIFRFFKDSVLAELTPLFKRVGGKQLVKLMHSKYLRWFAPILGALIIMSPIPDEVGIGLMGISHLKNWQFLGLSFILGSVGIFIIISFM